MQNTGSGVDETSSAIASPDVDKDSEHTWRELESALQKVQRMFDTEAMLRQHVDHQHIINYYNQSDLGYSFIHSSEGAVHMALNPDGVFSQEGYYEQPKIVNRVIAENHAMDVLELASGKGFNSRYLAQLNPTKAFIGVELTPNYVKKAQEDTRGIENLQFMIGDFEHLPFPDQSFDLIFVVESFCHACDMKRALEEVYRALRSNGIFIVVDGYRRQGFDQLDARARTAAELVEQSMAVGNPQILDEWLDLARRSGFTIDKVDDYTSAIMPNLLRFQRLAKGYFKYRPLGAVFQRVLPHHLVENAIAGLLMPLTIRVGAHGYYAIQLRRTV